MLLKLNVAILVVFIVYLGLFYPSADVSRLIIILPVLAVAIFFFNLSNASRLYHFSSNGGYALLMMGIAINGIFFILSLAEISM